MKTIYLVPRGRPDQFAQWHDPRPKEVIVAREDDYNWYGKPASNPQCPELQWPKFAWETVSK